MDYLLEATNISKSFLHPQKIQVLSNVDLQVPYGESVAIMGASGEGKTTFLHILGLLEKPDSGSLKICKEIPNSSNAPSIRNNCIGFIFQDYNLLEDLSVFENVLLPAKVGRKSLEKHSKRTEKFLDMVGLISRKNFLARQLSGGERQRVAIARAFCNNPDLILADEPSGNLDHENSGIIHELLLGIVEEEKKALIIATHDRQLAKLCSRNYEMKNHQLVAM